MRKILILSPFLLVFISAICFYSKSVAEPDSFAPTWKLLKNDDKQQFISGYLHGWRDAAKVIDVAISYVKDNPGKAVDGLEGLKRIYNLSGLRPNILVEKIDDFYSNPENSNAPLSAAITAARRE